MSGELEELKEQLAAMIISFAGDLHVQMQQMETRITERLDRMEARLDRHGGMLRAGSIWIDRMTRWSEAMDEVLSKMDARLRNLENGASPSKKAMPPGDQE